MILPANSVGFNNGSVKEKLDVGGHGCASESNFANGSGWQGGNAGILTVTVAIAGN